MTLYAERLSESTTSNEGLYQTVLRRPPVTAKAKIAYENIDAELRRYLLETEGPCSSTQSAGCPVDGRSCHWENDYESFIAEWFHLADEAPSINTIASALNSRGFHMKSDKRRRLSRKQIEHTLKRLDHQGRL